MNRNEKGSIIIIVLIIVVLICAAVFFLGRNEGKETNSSEFTATTTSTGAVVTIPEEYVMLDKSTAHEARFEFKVGLDEKTITKENIKVCVTSASVGNDNPPICEEWEKYEFAFDRSKNILTISELNIAPEDQGRFGIFGSGCASCMHQVELSGLRTKEGVALPTKSILVY